MAGKAAGVIVDALLVLLSTCGVAAPALQSQVHVT